MCLHAHYRRALEKDQNREFSNRVDVLNLTFVIGFGEMFWKMHET